MVATKKPSILPEFPLKYDICNIHNSFIINRIRIQSLPAGRYPLPIVSKTVPQFDAPFPASSSVLWPFPADRPGNTDSPRIHF